jgi:hypothetical protein
MEESVTMNEQNLVRSNSRRNASSPETSYLGVGIAIGAGMGIILGVVFGVTLGNMAFMGVGLAIGVGCGISIGSALDARSKRDDS